MGALPKLTAWIVEFADDHADEHRQTPLVPERVAELEAGKPTVHDHDHERVERAHQRWRALIEPD